MGEEELGSKNKGIQREVSALEYDFHWNKSILHVPSFEMGFLNAPEMLRNCYVMLHPRTMWVTNEQMILSEYPRFYPNIRDIESHVCLGVGE
jgi:hypothetical protein